MSIETTSKISIYSINNETIAPDTDVYLTVRPDQECSESVELKFGDVTMVVDATELMKAVDRCVR